MELFSFLKLYEGEVFGNDGAWGMIVILLSLYGNAGLYIFDLYGLLKKKTAGESIAVLLFPGTLAVMGSALLAFLIHIPASDQELSEFAVLLENRKLAWQLILAVAVCTGLWLLASSPGKSRRTKKAQLRWMLSGAADAVLAVVVFFAAAFQIVTGTSLFEQTKMLAARLGFEFDVFLWIFLYALLMLLCKVLLLCVSLFVRLYAAKIPHTWKEGKSPARFVFLHLFVCQNALLRGNLAFYIPLLGGLTAALVWEGQITFSMAGILFFLYMSALFVASVMLRKPVAAWFRFWKWGDAKRLMLLFCQEYCQKPPLVASEDFTVTQHFLLEEQHPAAIYCWNELVSCTGWISCKEGWRRQLHFRDGQVCSISREDAKGEEVARFARRLLENPAPAFESAEFTAGTLPIAAHTYESVVQKLLMIMLLCFMSVGTWVSSGTYRTAVPERDTTFTQKSFSGAADDWQEQTEEENPFPVQAAGNANVTVYVTDCDSVVWDQRTQQQGGKIRIISEMADAVSVSIYAGNGSLLQKLRHVSPLLCAEEVSFADEFARLEDVNADGEADLLLRYDNTEGDLWSVYLWNGSRFETDAVFQVPGASPPGQTHE